MNSAAPNMYPSSALASLFSSMGRGILWVLVRGMRAPLTSTIAIFMTVGVVSATSNALFFQTNMHPAPMFGERAMTASTPAMVPQKIAVTPPVLTQPVQTQPVTSPSRIPVQTQSVLTQPAARPSRIPTQQYIAPAPQMPKALSEITHANIKAAQEKLAGLGLYAGEADGFYGPNTATAIRAFEAQNGLPSVGALTPQILTQINAAKPPVVSQPVSTIVAPRRDDLGQLVESVTKEVADGGRQLSALANQVTQTMSRELTTAAKPDRLEQIVQKVATINETRTPTRQSATGPAYVKQVQSGLASLGFLQGPVDGVAGENTARAIRNFEVYYNYNVTGAITPELIDLLAEAGAKI